MNIKPTALIKLAALFAITTIFSESTHAQMTATWTGLGSDTDWNNTANWDIGTPAEGTNAVIGAGIIVDYSAPMTATSFAGVNNSGTLNVSAPGFNIDAAGLAAYTGNAASLLRVNSGGVMVATNSGTITQTTGSEIALQGGVLIITNSTGNINFGANGNNAGAGLTNNGGAVIFSQPFLSRGRFSRFVMNGGTMSFSPSVTNGIFETSNDQERQFLINGGTANLGNFTISRTLNTVGAAGLVISNGTVNTTSLTIGTGQSAAGVTVAGGVLTNTGAFIIADRTNAATSGQRRIFFYVRGGSIYSTAPSGIVVANQANTNLTGGSGVWGGFLDISSGLVVAEKLTLVGPIAVTNAFATLTLAGTGALYLGSGGLVGNVGYSNTAYTVTLGGGTLGAKADYAINANATLSGAFTVNAADLSGAPHNITDTGIWGGSGTLTKTGPGTLSFNTNNTYSGNTIIDGGALALGTNGSISNSPQIILTNGGIFDVSAKVGINLVGSQALSGQGTIGGNITANSGNGIKPGGNNIAGTITFSNALTETGGVLNNFDLSTNPNSGNDFINITGDLNLSGTNIIQVNALNGPLPAATTYVLIHYGGNLTGNVANLSLSGASGSLTLDTGAKTISLAVSSGIRGSTNVTWIGIAANSNWDMLASSNWLNGSSRDYFVAGDFARFDDSGATNPTVTIVGSVLPGSMVVDSTSNYTFTGTGTIDGSGGLTKTNSGTLTLLTANNNYPGATVIGGGTIEAAKLANGGSPSSLGAAVSSPANLQFFDASLRYTGGNVSIDRGVTLNGNAKIDVTASSLTISGDLGGGGNLTKSGAGTLVLSGAGSSYSGTTTVSNGTLQINNNQGALGTNSVNLAGGTLFLNIGGQPIYTNSFNVQANSGINVGGNNTVFSSPWSGAGVVNININSGGFFTFNSDITTNFVGTLYFGNSAGTFRFNAGGNSTGAQQSSGSPFINYDLGTNTAILVNRNGGGSSFGTYFLGGLTGGSNTTVRGSANSGSTSTYRVGDLNLDTVFAGTIQNGFANQSTPQSSAAVSIFKVGTGTLTLSGTNTYTGSTIISNGVLALSGFGTISNSTTILVVTNTVLNTSGRVDGALSLNSGQTLQGSGTVRGSLNVLNGANLTVGDDATIPEAMIITNSLTLQSGGTLNMDLDYFQFLGARTNDVILGLSSVTYGGTLNLNVTSIETNSIFKLFSAGSYSGAFGSIVPALPPLSPAVWGWDTSHLDVDGTLRITGLKPSITSLAISGTDLTITGINGIPGADAYLLTSTNIALPLNQWTSIGTNNFGGGGNFTFTFSGAVNPAASQQFYLLQVP